MANAPLTIIVPTYNSIDKMIETLASLEATTALLGCDVVFVDDCSTDDTYARLLERAASQPTWRVERLERNSGSAAAPRNRGLDLAQGEYIFFLDSDDVLIPGGVKNALDQAFAGGYDIVRSALVVRYGDGREVVGDRIPQWSKIGDLPAQIRAITKHQSLTVSSMFRRGLLDAEGIRFDPTRRIGEDIVFTAQALAASTSVTYRDAPIRTYVRTSAGDESVTQKINSVQFADFIKSWSEVESTLERRNVSFVAEHGFAALNYALRQFVWFGVEPLSPETFALLHTFTTRHWRDISKFPFSPRLKELVVAAKAGDREAFNQAAKLRLVIAGHDLKFMGVLEPRLAEQFETRVDRWVGLAEHDEAASEELLRWGDLFWVEWLLGAAEWYSNRLRNDQRLVVRMHRTEMGVDQGLRVKDERVAAYIAIAPHTLGDFADRFDIPREKIHLIPNAFDLDAYDRTPHPDRQHRIGMVGILPKLKRFDLAIRLLARLRQQDPELELHVFGKQPHELAWLMRSDAEREFYAGCEALIDELGVRDAIVYRGWVDTREVLCEMGAIVSMSDFEGMQVALGEAYAAETLGVTLPWRGVEACYPREFVFDDVDAMADFLATTLSDPSEHARWSSLGRRYMEEHYSLDGIWEQTVRLLKGVRA